MLVAATSSSMLLAEGFEGMSPAQIDAACRQMKRTGTAKDVPALASLLGDEVLSESGRFALESMECPEAGEALIAALPKTSGKTRTGIIDSLGARRERKAVGAVGELLANADVMVASAACNALGKIGGAEAMAALLAVENHPSTPKEPLWHAMVGCARIALTEGDRSAAANIAGRVHAASAPKQLRIAAYRLRVLASEKPVAMLVGGLAADDAATRLAAVSLVREVAGPDATAACASALAGAAPEIQPQLVEALAQRGDPAAAPAVLKMLDRPDAALRASAIRALAILGDASAVGPLVKCLGDPATAAPARETLSRLRGQAVREAILAEIGRAQGTVKTELIRVLGERRQSGAADALLKLAESSDEALAMASLQALATSGDEGSVGGLVSLLVKAASDDRRAEAEKAIGAICARSTKRDACARSVVEAWPRASAPARCSLLRLSGQLGGEAPLKILRDAMKDADPAVSDAAIRGLCATPDPAAMGDLLALAGSATDQTYQVLALRGCVRLVDASSLPLDGRARTLRSAMSAAKRDDEVKLILGALGKVPTAQALDLIEPCLAKPSLRPEALAAAKSIAATASDAGVRDRAGALVGGIKAPPR
jgi:HEAT repeat protein